MKRLLTFLTLLTVFIGVGWADEVTYSIGTNSPGTWSTTLGGGNGTATKSRYITTSEGFTITQFNPSSTNNTSIGAMNASYMGLLATDRLTISGTSTITKIVYNFTYYQTTYSCDVGSFTSGNTATGTSANTLTWEGSATSITLTPATGTKQNRLASITITYTSSGPQTCAKPTFTPDGGTFYDSQEVELSCTTDGATISYKINDDDWQTYSTPFTITETSTIQAKASKTNYTDSDVETKTFTKYSPSTVVVPPTYTETLISGLGSFYVKDVSNGKPSGDIWTSNSYGAVGNGGSGTGNNATLYASESWLISPYIDLTNVSSPVLSFSHAGNRFTDQTNMKADVKVLIKKKSDTQWTELDIATWPEGNSWTFVDNTTTLPSTYAGQIIQIAFKYTSTDERAGVWEVKNFSIGNTGTYEIFRNYKTLGENNNNAQGWMGYWGGGATTPNGSDYDNYTVQAQSGSTVTFLIGNNNGGFQLLPSDITVTYGNGTTVDDLVISDLNQYGQTPVSFTMPPGDVTVTADFTRATLRLAGHFNGNSTWRTGNAGPAFTYNRNGDTYTIDAYFTGIDDNGYNDFFFLTLGGEEKHPQANGNYFITDVEGGEMSFNLSGGSSNNFGCAPGVYQIEINGALTSMKFTKQTPTISFSPVAGDVASGTVVTATSTLTSLISGVKENYDSNADGTVTVGVNTDNGNTWNPSETLSTVGPATVYGKAYIGNISVTGQASYNVEEVEGDEYTLVTDVDDIDENGEYVIVTSNAFDNQYYAFGAISGGTAAQSTDFALVGNKVIVTGESVNVLKMSGNNTDGWSIQQLSDDNYLKNGSSTNISTDNNQPTGTWSITIDENNIAKITFSATTSRSIIYRQNANGFKNYSTNDATGTEYSKVKLYKKGTVTPKVETPTFNPEEGTYTEAQSVAINCATEGATIYYTINGSNPTVQYGTVYTGPINVESTTTIKAIAVKDNYLNSDVATATYTIHTSVIGEGDFTLVESDGDIEADREYIIINSAKDKAASAYASNRFTSTENFELTNNDKTASVESDVKIFILEAGENSGKYYLKDSEGNYYTPATGNGNITQNKTELTVKYSDGYVVITSGTVGSTRQIGYNEQGGQEVFGSFTPNSISPTGNGTLRPIYLYYRGGSAVATPVINPASKTFTEEFDATITCSTQGATIYYTTDGTDPTTSSAVYSSPIHVDKTMTIKAIAALDGEVSGIAEAVYQCTMVENIAEYLALPIGTTGIVFKNPVIVQYHYISGSGKSYIYVKDDTGCAYFHQPYETEGTPSMTQFEKGDIIAGGFYGNKTYDEAINQVSEYAMFTNLQNFVATGNKALVEPEEYKVSDLTADLNNHYITIKKVKLSALYDAGLGYGGSKYFDIDDAAHLGYNKFNIDWSVVDDLDAYYNVTAIFTAYNNNLEVHPIEIVKWAETELTLKELCVSGEEGESYRITNNLQGVYVKGTSLWVKDENGQSKYLVTPTAPYTDNFEIEHEDNTRSTQADYDQSNWLEVVCRTETEATSLKNKIIKGYSIVGTFNKKANPKLTLSSDAEITVYGNSDVYAPNYYIPANFVGSQTCNTEQYGQEGHGNFFFMTPKPQEYAMVVWAVYDGLVEGQPTFIMSPDPARNTHQFVGTFVVDLSMNTGATSTSEIREGFGYDFEAIIRKVEPNTGNAPALRDVQSDQSASYIVYPLNLDEGQDPVTSINDITNGNGEVKSVKYVNVAGIVSDVPFQGVNIVVTEYTDGSRTTTKMLKK